LRQDRETPVFRLHIMRSFSGEGLLIFRRKRSLAIRRGFRPALWLGALAAFIIWLLVLFERAIVPTLIVVSETEVMRVANQAMVDALNAHVAQILNGKDLLDFHVNQDGELLYVQVNAANLNRIQSEALAVLQESFSELEGFKVYVPLGQALGSSIFAPSGPRIPITLYPYGSVEVNVNDSYEVTGINQTKFEVWLTVTCMVRVVIPLISARTEFTTDVPLTTVLIPGKVPPTYLSIPKAPQY
jgi:sporulation protein YunB